MACCRFHVADPSHTWWGASSKALTELSPTVARVVRRRGEISSSGRCADSRNWFPARRTRSPMQVSLAAAPRREAAVFRTKHRALIHSSPGDDSWLPWRRLLTHGNEGAPRCPASFGRLLHCTSSQAFHIRAPLHTISSALTSNLACAQARKRNRSLSFARSTWR